MHIERKEGGGKRRGGKENVGEMAWWLKCLLCSQEDSSVIPNVPVESTHLQSSHLEEETRRHVYVDNLHTSMLLMPFSVISVTLVCTRVSLICFSSALISSHFSKISHLLFSTLSIRVSCFSSCIFLRENSGNSLESSYCVRLVFQLSLRMACVVSYMLHTTVV